MSESEYEEDSDDEELQTLIKYALGTIYLNCLTVLAKAQLQLRGLTHVTLLGRSTWMDNHAAAMKGRPLRCRICPGVLMLNAPALRQHVTSKHHKRRLAGAHALSPVKLLSVYPSMYDCQCIVRARRHADADFVSLLCRSS